VGRCGQARRSADRLKENLVLSGVSALEEAGAAARFGPATAASNRVEGYVERARWAEVQDDFGLHPDAEGQVVIRIADVSGSPCRAVRQLSRRTE